MAMIIDGNNSVFEKKAGTGAAYILPESQAIGIYQAGIADQNERKRLQEAALLKRQQEIADGNLSYLNKIEAPDVWENKNNALMQDEYNRIMKKGFDMKLRGADVTSDSDYLGEIRRFKAAAGAYGNIRSMVKDNDAAIGKDPDGWENALERKQFLLNINPFDMVDGKVGDIPQLRKIHTIADVIKNNKIEPAYDSNNDGTWDTTRVNRGGIIDQVVNTIDSPQSKYIIGKLGGDKDAYLTGFPVAANGKRLWKTDDKTVDDIAVRTLATDVNFPDYLKSKGYDISDTNKILSSAKDYIKKQNDAVGTFVQQTTDTVAGSRKTDTTRVFSAEANSRARRDQQIQEERLRHDKNKWADEELAARPDEIATNVVTNLASRGNYPGTDNKIVRTSTSLAASNVGNAKTPFLPTIVYESESGSGKRNTSPITVSGGQVHIKPTINFDGGQKILDDESLKKLRAGTYRLNGKTVPRNTPISYDELLYGEERVPAEITELGNQTKPATIRKVIIPVTGQALDKKFDKQYNRAEMWEKATSAAKDFDTKFELVKQQLLMAAPNMPKKELEKLAFETAKQY